jgi:hypothetical protein
MLRLCETSCFLSTPALFMEKSSQLQEAENRQTKPEIYQGSEVKLVNVMPGGFRQVGIEGEIQAIAKDNGSQVFEPFHGYGFHLFTTHSGAGPHCGYNRDC